MKSMEKKVKDSKTYKNLAIIFFVASIFFILIYAYFVLFNPKIDSIKVAKELNKDFSVDLTTYINYFGKKDVYCAIGTTNDYKDLTFKKADNNICTFAVNTGEYYIFIKEYKDDVSDFKKKSVSINAITDVVLNKEVVYLALNGTTKITFDVKKIGTITENFTSKIENEEIAVIEDDIVTGKKLGTTKLIVTETNSKITKEVEIIVTGLVNNPKINNNRKILSCNYYSKADAQLLDKILASRINDAGYKTRAGVVAAARFLTLEFPRKISYFFENGRLNNHSGGSYVDGEGRYYHVGLYLDTSKFKSLKATFAGPAIWGCPLTNYEDSGNYKKGYKYPNGLDCSGFVSWALLNGGFDVGDSGAGDYSYRDDDLPDNGDKVKLTVDLLKSGRVKVGDLIGSNLHAAIIVGLENDKIYIAESLEKGVVVETFTFSQCVKNKWYDFIVLMDKLYKEDGNLTNMWN